MNHRKFWGGVTIIFLILLILPSTGTADEIELNLFKTKAKKSNQVTYQQAYRYRGGIEFGLRLMGGGTYLLRNDINDYLQGMNEEFNDIADQEPAISAEPNLKPVNMGIDLSGELFINFNPYVGIGFGAGYISVEKESSGKIFDNMGNSESYTYYPKFSAIPITFSLYLGVPMGGMTKIIFDGGAGYYLGTINYDAVGEATTPGFWVEETRNWCAKSNVMGFHGGIHFEFGFTQNSAFVIGARGRYAKFTNLTADLKREGRASTGQTMSETKEDQTLWFIKGEDYPVMTLSEDKPRYSDSREAEVNLSGIIFHAGIKLTF